MIFILVALLMLTLAGRLFHVAAWAVQLHKHGARTTGTVNSVWEDTDRDGPPQLRASIGFNTTDGKPGWLQIPARRRESTLQAGDRLPIVYDPRDPMKAQVLPLESRRLLVSAGVMVVFAVGAIGFAGLVIGIAFGGA